MVTRKTIALTLWTFGGKVMSLVFNALFKFVIAFLPRSKHFLLSRLQEPFPVWVSPLELRESHRGWMKAAPCNQRNRGHKGLVSRSPIGSCTVSHPSQSFFTLSTSHELIVSTSKKVQKLPTWTSFLGPFVGDLHAHKLFFSLINLFCINLIIRAAKRTQEGGGGKLSPPQPRLIDKEQVSLHVIS